MIASATRIGATDVLAVTDAGAAERHAEPRDALELSQPATGAMIGVVDEVHPAVPIEEPRSFALHAPREPQPHGAFAHTEKKRARVSERRVVRKGRHAEVAL